MTLDDDVIAVLDDRQALALTGWAEARQTPRNIPSDHSPVEELIAVMIVVRNRRAHPAKWRATDASYKAICVAPSQFSCWNPGADANHLALMSMARGLVALGKDRTPDDPLLRECLYLADGVISGALIDRTGHATSYYAPAAMKPVGRVPTWAQGKPSLLIGDQIFMVV